MHFTAVTLLSLTALSTALPATRHSLTTRQAAAVLGSTTYDDISIAGGTAGNAEAEALAIFSALDLENPENISKDDQDFLNEVNQVANDAETEAFNPAIDAASGADATALQNGKIKNKVLKLTATILKLEAQQAQGKDVTEKMATEQKKLDNNIALDKAAAGQPSTKLAFSATIQGAGRAAPTATAGNARSAAVTVGRAQDSDADSDSDDEDADSDVEDKADSDIEDVSDSEDDD